MEYALIIGFVGWLYALISISPAAPSFKVEAVTHDLSYAEEVENVIPFRKAA
ncbi:MAG: hypothetical protein OEV92_04560 [Nitrospinota bacterium]|nr:hypothetical protein [Nitrospinota bacterium]